MSWLARFRVFAALDAGESLPGGLAKKMARSQELREFAESLAAIDSALKTTPPRPELPAFLHEGIMGAVEASRARPAPAVPSFRLVPWLAAPALALLVFAGAWWVRDRVRSTALQPATAALNLGSKMPETIATSAIAPLSDELDRLNRDLDQTKEFLLASLP